jgi:PadR family transcriptional regulator, regulatory protein PadR
MFGMDELKITRRIERLLEVFLAEPEDWHFPLDLCQKARVSFGWIYPHLALLVTVGWVDRHMQTPDEAPEGRLPRALYRITDDGRKEATRALARKALARRKQTRLVPAPQF